MSPLRLTLWRMCLCGILASGMLIASGGAQSSPPSPAPPTTQPVPVIDGGIGRCTLELTVLTPDGKPAPAATVKVHIAYGFGGFHRLDLEAGANYQGKVKFTGLPSRVRRPPLEFHASKGDLAGIAVYDPETECQAKHDLTLEKKSATAEP